MITRNEDEITVLEHLEVDPKDAEKISDGIPQYTIDRMAEFFLRMMREEWKKQNQDKAGSSS